MDSDCVASSVKLLYLGILYRFIAGKNILSRNLCHFIGAGKLFSGFFYRFIGEKNFGQKNCIVLFDFFFSKIVYRYRCYRYIFKYRCPPMVKVSVCVGGGSGIH
jgi:hypothetical protein